MKENVVLMSRKQVAEKLMISLRSLDKLVAERKLVGAKMGGCRLMFRQDDVDRYILEQFKKAAK